MRAFPQYVGIAVPPGGQSGRHAGRSGKPMWQRQDDLVARLTIRGYLALLTLAILLPVLIFSAILYSRYYSAEQTRIETDLLNDARQLALTVERDLAGLQNTAQT